MNTMNSARQGLMLALTSACLAACGTGGSSTSSSTGTPQYTPLTIEAQHNAQPQNTSISKNTGIPAVEITPDNMEAVAGATLKAMVLSDISANALNQSVRATQQQPITEQDIPTGVVIKMRPVNCYESGQFSIEASMESITNDLQLDLASDLAMSIGADFNQCDQGGIKLDGEITLDFTALLNNLMSSNNFSLETEARVKRLMVTQQDHPPFIVSGDFQYDVYSPDGTRMITKASANSNLYYTGESSYQIFEYTSEKIVNLQTLDYEYDVTSSFDNQLMPGSRIDYQTVSPIKGNGFSTPHSGEINIYGANQTIYLKVLNSDVVEMHVDYQNDNVVDGVYYSTWNQLGLGGLFVH